MSENFSDGKNSENLEKEKFIEEFTSAPVKLEKRKDLKKIYEKQYEERFEDG